MCTRAGARGGDGDLARDVQAWLIFLCLQPYSPIPFRGWFWPLAPKPAPAAGPGNLQVLANSQALGLTPVTDLQGALPRTPVLT